MGNRKRRRLKEKLARKSFQLTPPGTAPGAVVADPNAKQTSLHVIGYSSSEVVEQPIDKLSAVSELMKRLPVTWLNVDGLGNAGLIKEVGSLYSMHRLALEDVLHVHQRPKMEIYDDHHFIVARMASFKERLETEQFSIFVGTNYIVTFQEAGGDCLDPVRQRIRSDRGKIRSANSDYLAYAILDAVIDGYFPVLEALGERMDELEDEIIENPQPDTIARIHDIKRDMLSLRRSVWPLREVINTLIRDPHPLVKEETRFYLRDCYDHIVRIIDLVETYRELAADLMDLYLSILGNRTNEIMRVLTIISTIFIPLTFIVGVYGMNFDPQTSPWNMPELTWQYGYPFVWSMMLTIVVGLLLYFRNKGWLSGSVKNHSE